MIFLPYADDKRKVDFTEKVPASREQVDKMKEIVQKLRFKYRYMEINSMKGVAWGRKHNAVCSFAHIVQLWCPRDETLMYFDANCFPLQ